jgi:hypothetical protein
MMSEEGRRQKRLAPKKEPKVVALSPRIPEQLN